MQTKTAFHLIKDRSLKKQVLLFFLLFSALSNAFCQDLIYKRNGEHIEAEVLDISKTNVTYSRNNVVFSIAPAELFMIKFADGSKALFEDKKQIKADTIQTIVAQQQLSDSLKLLGDRDARKHYRAFKGAATCTFISSFLFPPAGLVVAVSTSSTRPSRDNLNYPSETLFRQPAYINGYGERAHKRKQEQVWTNFLMGTGLSAVIGLFVIPAVAKHI